MQVITVRNVHEALPVGLDLIERYGVPRDARGNTVCLEYPTPVTTVYEEPMERVIFWPDRDANPFFHLIEASWMMAGRKDVDLVGHYARNMYNYAEDDGKIYGAYGHRWRRHFQMDQLNSARKLLTNSPGSRRCVVTMWNPNCDLFPSEEDTPKDLPCNTSIFFIRRNGLLDMTVNNRSNDIIWGAYGANAVHMSILHEYMARSLNMSMGRYYQVSNNYHVYKNDVWKKCRSIADRAPDPYRTLGRSPYETGVLPTDLVVKPDAFIQDCFDFCNLLMRTHYSLQGMQGEFPNSSFNDVIIPMARAHYAWRYTQDAQNGIDILADCPEHCDWAKAGIEWLRRRGGYTGATGGHTEG